jgi:hypothetical protein
MGVCNSNSIVYKDSPEFINYCKNGDLINAKKHYDENPNIDIHAKNEQAFRSSCGCGRLEVAK